MITTETYCLQKVDFHILIQKVYHRKQLPDATSWFKLTWCFGTLSYSLCFISIKSASHIITDHAMR